MADRSAIEWTDSTFNPWTGCTKVSHGCDHCYAESWSGRAGAKVGKWGPGAPRVRTSAANWRLPVKWNNTRFLECSACGWRGESCEAIYLSMPPELYDDSLNNNDRDVCPRCRCEVLAAARRRVFCASLADVFDNEVDTAWRLDLLNMIRVTPALDWLILSKRIGNAMKMLASALALAQSRGDLPDFVDWLAAWIEGSPPANVWLGATIVNQEEADRDIPKLLATPARVRFLSMEPLLGPVDLQKHLWRRVRPDEWMGAPPGHDMDPEPQGVPLERVTGIDWVIVGSESGHGARRDPAMIDWVRALRDQCTAAGVAFLWKQDANRGRKIPSPLLDGRTWQEFPT